MGAETAVYTVFTRHSALEQRYRSLLQIGTLDAEVATLMKSMAEQHADLAVSYRKILEDYPDSPVKPNRQSREHDDSFSTNFSSAPQVFSYLHGEEEALRNTYSEITARDGYPEPLAKQMKKGHQKVVATVDKLDKLIKTGKDLRMEV